MLGYGTCAIGLFCVLWGALFISVAYEALGIFLGIVGFALGARRPGTATVVISAVALILVLRGRPGKRSRNRARGSQGRGTPHLEETIGGPSNKKRVAIACQGGGSHTAFTAGVLKGLLRSERLQDYEVVGLSGTSGGAVCALLAWHNLLRATRRGRWRTSTPSGATTPPPRPTEQVVNNWTLWASQPPELRRHAGGQPLRQLLRRAGARRVQGDAGAAGRFRAGQVQPKELIPCCSSGPLTCSPASSGPSTAGGTGSPPAPSSRRRPFRRYFAPCGSRRGDLLGRALLAEPPGQGAHRRAAGRDLGDPDKPEGDRGTSRRRSPE